MTHSKILTKKHFMAADSIRAFCKRVQQCTTYTEQKAEDDFKLPSNKATGIRSM